MTTGELAVKQNYLAILVAAVVCFLLEAAWYSFFIKAWLNGIGRTMEWLVSSGVNPAFQYAVALVCAAIFASAISCITQLTGELTTLRAIKVAAILWFGFIFTTLAFEYTFEVRPISLLAINAGFLLIGMTVMGAIVGAWKKK